MGDDNKLDRINNRENVIVSLTRIRDIALVGDTAWCDPRHYVLLHDVV